MRFRGPAFAMIIEYLTFVLLALTFVFAVGLTIQALTGARGDILVKATAALAHDLLPKGVYPTGEQRPTIVIDDPSDREQRLALAMELLRLLLAAAVLWLVLGIARSVRKGDPFIAANARRLRAIGGLLILGVLAVHFANGALQDELLAPYTRPAADFEARGLRPPDGSFPGVALLCGLGILALAQVFAHGTRLREDVAATI